MKLLLCAFLLCLPGAVRADFDMAQLIGNWAGKGRYVDGSSGGNFRCKMTVSGHSSELVLVSRCASAAGSVGSTLRLRKLRGGKYVAEVEEVRGYARGKVGALSGHADAARLILTGSAADDTATMFLRFDGTDLLHVAGEHTRDITRRASAVDYMRR